MKAAPDSDDATAASSTTVFVLPDTGEALLTAKHLAGALGLSASPLWERVKDDPDFPQPVRFSDRCTRFRLSDARRFIAGLSAGVPSLSPAQRRMQAARGAQA